MPYYGASAPLKRFNPSEAIANLIDLEIYVKTWYFNLEANSVELYFIEL